MSAGAPNPLLRPADLARVRALARRLGEREALQALRGIPRGATLAAIRGRANGSGDVAEALVRAALAGLPAHRARNRLAVVRRRRRLRPPARVGTRELAAEACREYGVSTPEQLARPPRSRPIRSAAAYVRACLARCGGGRDGDPWDARLLAAGLDWVPPSAWVDCDPEQRGYGWYYRYWAAAAARPDRVGSTLNPTPEQARDALRAGIPAWITREIAAAGHAELLSERTGYRGGRVGIGRLRRLRRVARACARTSIRRAHWRFRADALEALGRLSPELQREAVRLVEEAGRVGVRCRDLPWPEIARLRDAIRSGGDRVRYLHAVGRRADAIANAALAREAREHLARRGDLADLAGAPFYLAATELWRASLRDLLSLARMERAPRGDEVAPWVCPSYPEVDAYEAQRLARGEVTPRDLAELAGARLTSREAHEWLTETGARIAPLQWLRGRLPADCPHVRSRAVLDWLARTHERGAWGALTRQRTIRGPAGEIISIRYLDRVDEIQDEDLDAGAGTSVRRAFTNAAARCGEAWLERQRRDHRRLAAWPSGWAAPPRALRPLWTPAQLAREGDELGHCVGQYRQVVEDRASVILSVAVTDREGTTHRSTLELAREAAPRVLQHHGRGNGTPPDLCRRAVDVWFHRALKPRRVW